MHEEPYAQSILDMAIEKAGDRSITEIVLEVGRFSAIDPKSLEMFFVCLSKGTVAQKASLIFEIVPVTLECKMCHKTKTIDIPQDRPVQPFLASHFRDGCSCGSKKLTVTQGLGIEIATLKIE
ncbi:putative hydrogenase nickel incorporation protein hypA [Desulfamplus magnetovallimortis]|uniref:Putative hydrogenase nickel incorporation protein hypA n=1 Tax=Desulfamplus magnetovallimortis TaxID=1246637 RepID=A0A1W1HBS7_9BACT|nr:hydrogenase maturation nickel metallochaperone HypA [Desulfamplus magnetovallimortis]SLM29852.1 putative hydrogenase nickel incorporation protein hypA [Desulfamplus magnetovallimortis]